MLLWPVATLRVRQAVLRIATATAQDGLVMTYVKWRVS